MLGKNTLPVLLLIILFSSTCSLEGNLGGDTSYIVSFDKNGGNGGAPSPQSVKSSSSIKLPSGDSLSKNGFTFGGWNTESSGDGRDYSAGSFYTPTDNVTLYAKWIPVAAPTYTVTFDANGANGSPPAQQTIKSGSSITLPGSGGLAKSDYIFNGWNANASGTGSQYSAGSSYTVTENITFYAKWVSPATAYTVIFSANGGNGTAPAAQTVSVGSGITLPSGNGLSKSGSTFGGWNTNASGSGVLYGAGSFYTPNNDITLYANWNAVVTTATYTVTFNANGGSGTSPASQTVNAGSSITLPNGSGLSKSSFTFGGWNTNAGGTGSNYNAGDSFAVTGNVTLYAKWVNAISYTVTYNINGGSGTTPATQTASAGSSITLPGGNGLTKSGYTFGGWNTNASGGGTNYNAGDSYTVTGNVTLYAKWDDPLSSIFGLANKLSWLQSNAQSGGNYTFEVSFNESIDPTALSYNGKGNITITLKGIGSARNIILNFNGSMFKIGYGVTLILEKNIILQGLSYNTAPLIMIDYGGKLVMNTGSSIIGNTGYICGGVNVNNGTFTMNGGEISSNSRGGVNVSYGTFTMNGGEISSNSGSGVNVSNGTFTLSGGEISGNPTGVNNDYGTFIMSGGEISGNSTGVRNDYGTFDMSGGGIFGNTNSSIGGGVYMDSGGAFTMKGGKIFGNTASYGGGVYMRNGLFTMKGGEISGNTADSGGGVDVSGGDFTMYGGEISGNTVAYFGGGVCVSFDGKFNKIGGGTIYGYAKGDTNSNVVKRSSGVVQNDSHAVYISGSKWRMTTAGPGVSLDSSKSGAAGGWE